MGKRGRLDSALFGEQQSRIVMSISPDSVTKLNRLARKCRVPLTFLGKVGGKRLVVKRTLGSSATSSVNKGTQRSSLIDLPLTKVEGAWRNGLKKSIK